MKVIYILNLKLNFLRNHFTNHSQILYVVSLGRGTKVCINGPGHMTKMAAMPIYVVRSFKNQLLWNRWTDFNETWYVALGALALHSLCKS